MSFAFHRFQSWQQYSGRRMTRDFKSVSVAMGRDLDESTVVHSDTIINWPIKSDLENDMQVGITMNV